MKRLCLAILSWALAVHVHAQQPRNLMVEVRIEGQSVQDSQVIGGGIQTYGTGTFADKQRARIYGNQRTTSRSESSTQRLLVMDGGTATLSSVRTQPIRLRQTLISPYGKIVSDGYVYRSLGGSIRVTPRSRGDFVEIEVGAEESRPLPNNPTAADTLRLSTMIGGRMGEWIQIGDDQRAGSQGGGNIGGNIGNNSGAGINQGSQEESGSQQVWLRVTPQ